MKLAIVGTGYVGLVTGTCLAETGNDVTCVDCDARKIERLLRGEVPIYEPGLAELISRNVAAGLLHFTTDLAAAAAEAKIVFLAVGTPPADDGSVDLSALWTVGGRPGPAPGRRRDRGAQEHRAGRHQRRGLRPARRTHRPWTRGTGCPPRGQQPRVPQGRGGHRRLHEARPRGHRHQRRRGPRRALGPLPALPADRQAAVVHVAGKRGDDQVRGQRPAGDEDQLHQRDGQHLRAGGGRHQRGPPRHRPRQPHRLRLPLSRRGLRRQLLSQGRAGLGRGRPSPRRRAADPRRRPRGEPLPEDGPVREDRRSIFAASWPA